MLLIFLTLLYFLLFLLLLFPSPPLCPFPLPGRPPSIEGFSAGLAEGGYMLAMSMQAHSKRGVGHVATDTVQSWSIVGSAKLVFSQQARVLHTSPNFARPTGALLFQGTTISKGLVWQELQEIAQGVGSLRNPPPSFCSSYK